MHNHTVMPARTRTTFTVAIALLVGLLLALQPWAAGRAHAHDVLASSDPAAGATLATAPTQVSLTFNNEVLTGVANQIQVHGPDGSSVAGDGLASVDRRVVTVPVTATADGAYSVAWHVVSSDGHPVEGTFSFTVGAAGASTAPEATTAPGEQPSASSASAAPSDQQAGGQSDDSDHLGATIAWTIAGVVLVVIAVVAIVLCLRRSRRTSK
ncbi:copper resistance CopC family protein [Pseudoclavibacter sp. 13-3]|uniref:copper resistance CopC family protein n=1 Tax=Pseudoclavibacter sp. 13-3 TaxID=2901228 RepID=UPI001E528BE5|nr:copper resistance CopC family protein [Pseudoclavibacter sp. 13-3]MCD7101906.1 copper resistance protein CopC [Pseudoclavibacter sp. 13-3]